MTCPRCIVPCESAKCQGAAQFVFTWPGSPPQQVCLWCAAQAARVAEAMGFVLTVCAMRVECPHEDDQTVERTRRLEIE